MKKKIKISRKQWETIGKTSQWLPENDMKALVVGRLNVELEFVFDASDFSAEEVAEIRKYSGENIPKEISEFIKDKIQERRNEFEAQENKPFSISNGTDSVNITIV